MKTQLLDAWHTLVPPRNSPHGPLPVLLVLLTAVTGLIDAFSYLQLGRVFVANMTGNVVFLSFALGRAPGFLWWSSLLAIFTFSAGALLGGRIAHAQAHHRARHLLVAASAQTVFVLVAFIVAVAVPTPYHDTVLAVLIVLLGIGMGLQNATARALAVPDLTTTVLTLTITGISADSTAAGGSGSRAGRRLVPVASMFLGGLIGVLLVRAGHGAWALLAATVLLGAVTAAVAGSARTTADWARA